MLKFPSITAATITGSIWMPFFLWSVKYIDTLFGSDILLLIWSILGFMLPTFLSTGDYRYILRRMKSESTFFGKLKIMQFRTEDFQEFFFPAWIRIFVLFLSTVVSIMFIKLFGIKI